MRDSYITTAQAALLAGCGQTTVATACRKKILPAIRIKKNKRVHYEIHLLDFRRWHEFHRNETYHAGG